MSKEYDIANKEGAADQVQFKINVAGKAVSSDYKILSLEVHKQINKIAAARITLEDGDPAKQDFAISSKDDSLLPGSEIEIQMGYHAKVKTVFKGIIIRQALKSYRNKTSMLIIEARDVAVKMSIGRKNHCFTEKTDTDIITTLVKNAGIKDSGIADTKVKYPQMVQYNVSDWDFIVSRAEANAMVVVCDDNKLQIKEPELKKDGAPSLTYGVDIIEFESELDARMQLDEVTTAAWDFKEQQIRTSRPAKTNYKESGTPATSDLAGAMGTKEYKLVHGGAIDDKELQAWANGKLLKSKMARSLGKIKMKGASDIRIGQTIQLNGLGKRFNGPVYVSGITHSYDKSIWETMVHFGTPSEWFYEKEDIIEKPAAGLVPGIHGLQIAVVMQLENDPMKEDRIKLKLPLVDDKEGLWARIACLDAGSNRGAYFRPEIKDEVIVGFINDDPRHAVILGMLNSSAHPAPLKASDDNHEKGFVTRSKMKVIFNDEKKSITIETPKGKKVSVNDDADEIKLEDQNGNKITMGSKGISIESNKDISLKTSGGSIKLDGTSIENNATGKFSATGNATAEFKSSGPTILKGSIVNIN